MLLFSLYGMLRFQVFVYCWAFLVTQISAKHLPLQKGLLTTPGKVSPNNPYLVKCSLVTVCHNTLFYFLFKVLATL